MFFGIHGVVPFSLIRATSKNTMNITIYNFLYKHTSKMDIDQVLFKVTTYYNLSLGIDSQPGGPTGQPYLTYRPARLHRLAELLRWNQYLGPLKRLNIRAQISQPVFVKLIMAPYTFTSSGSVETAETTDSEKENLNQIC